MISIQKRDSKRYVEFGDDSVCLDVNPADEWSPPHQTTIAFANLEHRRLFEKAAEFPCPIDARMVFRAIVMCESKWKVTASVSAQIDFVVADSETFGFYISTIEEVKSRLKRCELELEKTTTKRTRFPPNTLKMFSNGFELTLDHTSSVFDSIGALGHLYREEHCMIPTQTVSILVESFTCDQKLDSETSPMHKNALFLASIFRVTGRFFLANIKSEFEDDITDAREFVTKHQTKKVSDRAKKEANSLIARLTKRIDHSQVDGNELATSQSKNNERRRLLEALQEYVDRTE